MEEGSGEGVKIDDAKGITPAVFGFLIAYIVPGLFAVITVGLYVGPIGQALLSVSSASSSTGLSLLLLFTAILAGLQLNIVRWAVYEKWLLRKMPLRAEDIAKLHVSSKAAQFQVLVDQVQRYHQFSGAQSIVIPVFAIGLVRALELPFLSASALSLLLGGAAVEAVTVWSAIIGWKLYVERCKKLADA